MALNFGNKMLFTEGSGVFLTSPDDNQVQVWDGSRWTYQDLDGSDIIDSYTVSNNVYAITAGESGAGQSITGNGRNIISVKVGLSRTAGSTSQTIVCKIYAHSGTFGTSSVPTGSALATSGTVALSTIPETAAIFTFTFTGVNQLKLVNGTKYCLVFEVSAGDFNVNLSINDTLATHNGNYFLYTEGDWSSEANWDTYFIAYWK